MTDEQRDKAINQIMIDIALIRQAVLGNGSDGHKQRIERLEAWKREHPRVCPMIERRASKWARISAQAGLTGVIFTIAMAALKLLGIL